jgi:hypothetical protein
VFGTNALTTYAFSEFLANLLHVIHVSGGMTLQRWLYRPLAVTLSNPSIAALSYAILVVAVFFLPPLLLNPNKIFLRI